MKKLLKAAELPRHAIVVSCSSHEDRCKALLGHLNGWSARSVFIFHYDDPNPRREANHAQMESGFAHVAPRVSSLVYTESDAVASFRASVRRLGEALEEAPTSRIVVDISVFTKRHLLLLLQWLDHAGWWDRLYVIYSEPGDYVVSKHIPLSFGLASLKQVPGFAACPDLSRPVHLMLMLGYEGDRAMAVYERVQPMKTTLAIPDPPYRSGWEGRTERLNEDLLTVVGDCAVRRVDALDPDRTADLLRKELGSSSRGVYATVVSPLGTKPQTLGVYEYLRCAKDPPAVIYGSPLRHNHDLFSEGIGSTWMLRAALP